MLCCLKWANLYINFNYRIKDINTTTNCEFFKRLKVSFGPFKAHIEIEIFKTADTKNILWCAKNNKTKIIQCSEVNYEHSKVLSILSVIMK